MAPIRVAIIGLSTSPTSWAAIGHLPYLLSEHGRSKYQIVALCNSSLEAAKAAIEKYKLAPETRAYGSPELLAQDPEVDLVVLSTPVYTHADAIAPSIRAGKSVYVEWPLEKNIDAVRELVALAREKAVRTIVGLQGRRVAPVLKLKELVESGRIGKVLSSEVGAFGGTMARDSIPSFLAYFAERKFGGNAFTIGFGHFIDYVQHVVGEIQEPKTQLQILRPQQKLLDFFKGGIVVDTVTSDVPDLVILTGKLPAAPHTVTGATFLARFRKGQPFAGDPPLVWTINGELGELRLTSRAGTLMAGGMMNPPPIIELHDFQTEKPETIEWKWPGGEWQEALPASSQSVAEVYEAFAAGEYEKTATFEDALVRHEQLEAIISGWSATNSDK